MISLGLDLGYSAVKAVLLEEERVLWSRYAMHRGRMMPCLREVLGQALDRWAPGEILRGAAVGTGASRLLRGASLRGAPEIPALVEGGRFLAPEARSLMEIGGQRARYVVGVPEGPLEVFMNSGCAAGTGSFLEEQMTRLGMRVEDYGDLARRAASVPRIAARCSVFAKSDIIHHQQEGVPPADILAGLARGVAGSYRHGVVRGRLSPGPILFCGGVSRNEAMVRALEEVFRLEAGRLRVHPLSPLAGALGAARIAAREGFPLDGEALIRWLEDQEGATWVPEDESAPLEPLAPYGEGDGAGKHPRSPHAASPRCWIGIDVGSTSTDLAALDETGRVLATRYLRTAGDPLGAVSRGLADLGGELGDPPVLGVAVTGSGRERIGRLVGADRVKDEITSQARGALALDPEADTVFEIGGQDSKYISLEDGGVRDFQMNKVCAAGTGAFLEEQASKLGIPLEDFGPCALRGSRPANLGERCTVFMESSVAAHLARGTAVEDIAAGLCHAIVRNYLNRVVGSGRVGKRVLLQGGIAHNQGVVNAFRAQLGVPVTVPPFFSVSGAVGAALLARDEMAVGEGTAFRGFGALADPAEPLPPGEATVEGLRMDRFTAQVQRDLMGDREPVPDPSRPTVGIPRALFCFGMYPLFAPFFRKLGLNVLLSRPSSEETVRLAREYSLDETCFPLKLVNGHLAELVQEGVDHIFFPDLHTVSHPGSRSRQCYGCAYMQLAAKMVDRAMDLKGRRIGLLAPTIAFHLGKESVLESFLSVGRALGVSESEARSALEEAMGAHRAFSVEMDRRAEETLASLDPSRRTFVVISKVYGVADPLLNMGIPGMLEDLGERVLPFYRLPDQDIFGEHPNLYWPFAQHTLGAARLVARREDLQGVFLSHHGCGPDSVTAHYLQEILRDKPFLSIEVDEHASPVGVRTRVEAFLQSLGKPRRSRPVRNEAPPSVSATPLWIPPLRPYATVAVALAAGRGIPAVEGRPLSREDVERGRRHALSGEYLSLSALLGSLLRHGDEVGPVRAWMPQNEGAEVDGQTGRWIQSVLAQQGGAAQAVQTPFLEDLPLAEESLFRDGVACVLAGDLILAVPPKDRGALALRVCGMAREGRLTPETLKEEADRVALGARPSSRGRILALGEPWVLYSPALNDRLLESLEEETDLAYAPLSEALWLFWDDLCRQKERPEGGLLRRRTEAFGREIEDLGRRLRGRGAFEEDLSRLREEADRSLGLYAGAFGRYRGAKALRARGVDGVLAVASLYENTHISLGILGGGAEGTPVPPCLRLVFDGTATEDNRTRVEAFLHYARSRAASPEPVRV